jgi:glycosyltransferase involved in cell wall biosynthesis
METTKHLTARILTSYYRPKPGGFCKRLFRGMNALLDAGCEIHYLAVVPFPIQHANCHFHRFPWPARYTDGLLFWAIFHLLAPFALTYLAYRYRISRMFAFSPSYGLLLQPARLLKQIPLCIFIRADTIENHRLKKRSSWLIRLELILEGLAIQYSRLYGVSDVLTKSISERHPHSRILNASTLKNDINPHYLDRPKRTGGPLRLAVVGILEPRKNQRLAIVTMKHLIPANVTLDLYGQGKDEKHLRMLVNQLELNNYISFHGWIAQENIWNNVDLLLMPSLHEGAPNALLEAVELGIPVLASDIPEHQEILTEENLLPLHSSHIWADRIQAILDNPDEEMHRLSASQRDATQHLDFDWNNMFIKAVLT